MVCSYDDILKQWSKFENSKIITLRHCFLLSSLTLSNNDDYDHKKSKPRLKNIIEWKPNYGYDLMLIIDWFQNRISKNKMFLYHLTIFNYTRHLITSNNEYMKERRRNNEYSEWFPCNYNKVIGNSCNPFKNNTLISMFCCYFPRIYPQIRLMA